MSISNFAMKSFIIKLIIFFLLFTLIDFSLGFFLQKINNETVKGDIGRNNYIMNDLVDKDIIIFGSSRAIHHYNPNIIGDLLHMSSYNCGEDGMGVILSYSRLQAILSRYTPKVVIYDIEPAYDIEKNDNERYLGKLKPFYPEYNTDVVFVDVSSTEKYKMWSKLYRFNSQPVDMLIQRLSLSPITGKDYTYSPLKQTMNHEPTISPIKNLDIDSLKLKYLKNFIKECKEKDISLFFALSPKFNNRTELDFLKKMCKEWNVPLLNHFTDMSFNMRKDLFCDQTHLNETGSIYYSKTIAYEILSFLSNDT